MNTKTTRSKRLEEWIGIAVTLAVLGTSTGCASLISGTRQNVRISSSPSAANIKVERAAEGGQFATVWTGTTPAVVNLKRKHSYLLTVSQQGYESAELGIEKVSNGWIWGNLIFFPIGTLIGTSIDNGTGAAQKLKPNNIFVELVPDPFAESPEPTSAVPRDVRGASTQTAAAAPSTQLTAPQFSIPQHSRKGFIIGFGVGPGFTSYTRTRFKRSRFDFVSERQTKTTVVTDFKIGYAPDDRLQIYWMAKTSWFGESDIFGESDFFGESDALRIHGIGGLGGSYALKPTAPSLFVNGGIGFSTWGFVYEGNYESDMQIGLSGGAGFEFFRHWIANLDLTWGKNHATSLRFAVSYLHY